jgi:hypothetical protein
MTLKSLAQILGVLGDSITFEGAILLATGEAGEEMRTREIVNAVTAYRIFPDLKKLVLERNGIIFNNQEDIEIAVARRFSKRAQAGAWLQGKRILKIDRTTECAFRQACNPIPHTPSKKKQAPPPTDLN